MYTPSGSCTTDFEFNSDIAQKIAASIGISSGKVHSYSDISLSNTWTTRAPDIYNLAKNGEYGGVILPITGNRISDDYYVVSCTFSDDVKVGEQISLKGFSVDTSTLQTVYNKEQLYSSSSFSIQNCALKSPVIIRTKPIVSSTKRRNLIAFFLSIFCLFIYLKVKKFLLQFLSNLNTLTRVSLQ